MKNDNEKIQKEINLKKLKKIFNFYWSFLFFHF